MLCCAHCTGGLGLLLQNGARAALRVGRRAGTVKERGFVCWFLSLLVQPKCWGGVAKNTVVATVTKIYLFIVSFGNVACYGSFGSNYSEGSTEGL